MTDQMHDQYDPERQNADLSRRDFVALSLAVGVAVGARPAEAALPVRWLRCSSLKYSRYFWAARSPG